MSSTPTHRPPSKAPPLPTAKATGSKTRRDGKTAKAPPGASDRGHSLDDANTVRRAKTPGTVRVGSAARHAVRAAKALRAPAAAPTPNNAAVVKVLGYRHSAGETVATMKYIRDKDGPTEDDWAQDVTKDHIALTEEWGLRDDDGRQTVHLMFSLPNTNPAAEWDAARDTIRELFPNRPYICTLHTDTDHPHVHVIARMRDYDGRKLRIDRETLHRYRETLTRHGRARGIDVEARRYAVPTRQRNKLRVFSEREPVSRQLDRHVAVLQKPHDATPRQIRKACKAITKHRDKLHDGHRRGLMRAVSAMEQHPTLQRAAARLCKVTFKGPRGKRFRAQRTQRLRVDALAASLEAAPVFDRPPQAPPAPAVPAREEPGPLVLQIDQAGLRAFRAARRLRRLEGAVQTLEHDAPATAHKAIHRALRTIESHHDVMTDDHRAQLLAAGRQWTHGMYRHKIPTGTRGAQRRLLDALGRSEAGRDFLQRERDAAQARDRRENAMTAKEQRQLVKQLSKNAEALSRRDHARARKLVEGLAPKQARRLARALKRAARLQAARDAAWRKARAPRTLTEALARSVTRAVETLVHRLVRDVALQAARRVRERQDPTRALIEKSPPPVRVWNRGRALAVEDALDQLARRSPAVAPKAVTQALVTLTAHQRHLTDAQRQQMLDAARRWQGDGPAGPGQRAVRQGQQAIMRLVGSGPEGEAFLERQEARALAAEGHHPVEHKIAKALDTLATTSLDDGPAMRAAMAPLKTYQTVLKTGHRERLLELAATWDRQDIARNQRQQTACDRLQRRADLEPDERTRRVEDIARAAAGQRRALHRHTAAIERIVCATKDGQRVHRDFLIDRAVRHLHAPPHGDPARARRALVTLAQRRAHLTDDHRAALLRHVQGWAARGATATETRLAWWQRVQDRPDMTDARKDTALTRVRARELAERASTRRHAWLVSRLIRHGEAGRAFVSRHRVDQALQVLATRTPPGLDARFARQAPTPARAAEPAIRDATIVVRKDVLTLNARQRAEVRLQAAALREDKTTTRRTRRQARKLAKALDQTASVEERAQVHLTRALATLARRDQADDRAWLHMRETFQTLHTHLTRAQRAELGQHAARMAQEPGRGRLAKSLQRVADRAAPTREKAAPSRKPTGRTR